MKFPSVKKTRPSGPCHALRAAMSPDERIYFMHREFGAGKEPEDLKICTSGPDCPCDFCTYLRRPKAERNEEERLYYMHKEFGGGRKTQADHIKPKDEDPGYG